MKTAASEFSAKVIDSYDVFCLSQLSYVSTLNRLSSILRDHASQRHLLTYAVLEIGSGTGECTRRILESFSSTQITAVDNNISIQQKAKEKEYNRFMHSSVQFYISDAFEFLIEAVRSRQTWDFIVAGFTLHNWKCDYRWKVLQAISKILRPGGCFVVADYFPECYSDAIGEFEKHIAWLETESNVSSSPDLRDFWVAHTLQDMNPNRLMYESAFVSDLMQIGFSEVNTDRVARLEAVVSASKCVDRVDRFRRANHLSR